VGAHPSCLGVTGQARNVAVMQRSSTGQSMLGSAFYTSCARRTVHRADGSASPGQRPNSGFPW
jgi:hypothetical protein